MLIPVLALAMMQYPCPLSIGVGKDGSIFFDRLNSWKETTPKMLEGVLHTGCWTENASKPNPITSVKFVVAAQAPQEKIDLVFSILKKEGWNSDRVTQKPWTEYPHKPR